MIVVVTIAHAGNRARAVGHGSIRQSQKSPAFQQFGRYGVRKFKGLGLKSS